jgi:glycosyltransferase involved in cell wall biosynthesis
MMKLLIDLIACQTSSRNRGIGRYTFELARALTNLRGGNDMICMADPLFPEGFEELRQEFIRRLPPGGFLPYFHEPVPEYLPINNNDYSELASALICQARQAVAPDIVLTPSLFEGIDSSRVIIPLARDEKKSYKQAVILYDLIPYIFREQYLDRSSVVRDWYMKRFNSLKCFNLLLAISESTRQDAIHLLNISPDRVINISGAISQQFRKLEIPQIEKKEFLHKIGITRPFVFYLGGHDFRKNMEGALQVFGNLPRELIDNHQLLINDVCDEAVFHSTMRSLSISDQDVVIIKQISDDDLVRLYNLCTVFIFPSLYEGFGLPVLEAMACGAPVLAANNSSLPEVVGRSDMLFDVDYPENAASTLTHLLMDPDYRADLSRYGLERAKQFSWENSARLAWKAMETLNQDSLSSRVFSMGQPKENRPCIAFVSPLPPQESGISEYSAELLPYLAEYYKIDLFVEPGLDLPDDIRLCAFNKYPWTELINRRDDYATVVYQFGNSTFHTHMFDLEQKFPGVVVLHDFFLSGLLAHLTITKGRFPQELDYSHGIKSLVDYQVNGIDVIWNWPMNWRVLRYAKEVIVHSEYQKKLLDQFYSLGWLPRMNVIRQLRSIESETTTEIRKLTREQLEIPEESLLICSFGHMGATKLNDKIIEAFHLSQQFPNWDCQLVFVGDCPDEFYYDKMIQLIHEFGLDDRIRITGFANQETYRKFHIAADITIQLRQNTRGETSRAVLDNMAFGLPVILNTHGTLNDYQNEDVVKISDPVCVEELSQVIIRLMTDKVYRLEKGNQARKAIAAQHNPEVSAKAFAIVVEHAIESDDRIILKPAINIFETLNYPMELIHSQARFATANLAIHKRPRILINISQIHRNDTGTGVERVVKRIIKELFHMEAQFYLIEPVYLLDGRLRRASRLLEDILELPTGSLGPELPLSINPGDSLIMLDSTWGVYDEFISIFNNIRLLGGKILTVVYDLIPIYYPHFFPEFLPSIFSKWLNCACNESDTLVCISQAVANDVERYRIENKIGLERQLDIGYFHLGADVPINSSESVVRNEVYTLVQNLTTPLYLSVGTLEPRKGHSFTLEAFEDLWKEGNDFVLVFAGKVGWNVYELESNIRNHPMLNKRFFFFENPSDAELEILYANATALITASIAEGFGLPIVEAAMHNVPTLASDIPVFHEVAGEGAIYFARDSQEEFTNAIKYISKLSTAERSKLVTKVKVISWKDSALWLLDIITGKTRCIDID